MFHSKRQPQLLNHSRGDPGFPQALTSLPTNTEQQCKKSNRSFATQPEASFKRAAQPSPAERCHLTSGPAPLEEHLPRFYCDLHMKHASTLLLFIIVTAQPIVCILQRCRKIVPYTEVLYSAASSTHTKSQDYFLTQGHTQCISQFTQCNATYSGELMNLVENWVNNQSVFRHI